jgi:hypothetical protein
MALEPRDQSILEFFGRNTDSSTVVSSGNFPKNEGGALRNDRAGVTDWNIAVLLAMD